MTGQYGFKRQQRRPHPLAILVFWALMGPWAAQAQKPSAELTACAAANRQAATELLQARESEIRRHALHAVLVSRLQGLGGSFAQLRTQAARAPRNLAECERTTEALTAGREQMERIVGTPAQLAECNAANQAAYAQMQATLLDLQSTGKASVPALEGAASRIALLRPALTREGLTLADCRQLASDVAVEVAQVQRLAPPAPPTQPAQPATRAVTAAPVAATAPPVAATAAPPAAAQAANTACRAEQTRTYNELAQAYAQFVSAGPIAQELMAPLQALSERLTRLSQTIGSPSAPGWDCEGINSALAQARSDLGKLKR
jgi:hypothetical protein